MHHSCLGVLGVGVMRLGWARVAVARADSAMLSYLLPLCCNSLWPGGISGLVAMASWLAIKAGDLVSGGCGSQRVSLVTSTVA